MRVKLIGRFEMRPGDENGDLAHVARQGWLVGERPHEIPARLAELRLGKPRRPWPDQRAVAADCREPLKVLLDPLFHIVVERTLRGTEFSGRNGGHARHGSPRKRLSVALRARSGIETYRAISRRRRSRRLEAAPRRRSLSGM